MGARARRLRTLTKGFLRRAAEAGKEKFQTLDEQASLDIHAVEDASFIHWVNEHLRKEKPDDSLP